MPDQDRQEPEVYAAMLEQIAAMGSPARAAAQYRKVLRLLLEDDNESAGAFLVLAERNLQAYFDTVDTLGDAQKLPSLRTLLIRHPGLVPGSDQHSAVTDPGTSPG